MSSVRNLLTGLTALPLALALAACSDSPRPYGDRTTAPPASSSGPAMTAPANTAAPTPSAPAAAVPPTAGEDVDAKKGTETGMVGGASGTTASGGKPGSSSAAGGGPSAAQSSGEPTEAKK